MIYVPTTTIKTDDLGQNAVRVTLEFTTTEPLAHDDLRDAHGLLEAAMEAAVQLQSGKAAV